MRPDVTVVMPFYNTLSELTRSVGSVMDQTIGLDRIQLVAVDDCSTDGTYEELQRLASQWPGMLVLRTEANSGSAGAPRNLALEHVAGRYIFMLDSDDSLAPDALERLVDCADRNSTEVVLPRLQGVGDREVSRSVFRRSQPRTDVFSSRVNWNLGPMKLYSAGLIERERIRFPEGQAFGSDQPFVTEAYLAAEGVSVLADKPYYFVHNREDRSNSTLVASPEARLRSVATMLALLTESVERGTQRDFLLRRQFNVDVMEVLRSAGTLERRSRDRILDSTAELTRPHYNESIAAALPPLNRVCIHLLYAAEYDALYSVLTEESDGAEPKILVEGQHAFELWPFFRGGGLIVPDSCYDTTDRLRTFAHLAAMTWKGSMLRLSGFAGIDRLDCSSDAPSIVLSGRDSDAELVLPAAATDAGDSAAAQGPDSCPAGAVGFSAGIDVATAIDGARVEDGLWDIHVRITCGDLVRDARLGSDREPGATSDHVLRMVSAADGTSTATVYHTKDFDNVTLDVGQVRTQLEVSAARVGWSLEAPATLEIAGSVNALHIPADAISVRLTNEAGLSFYVVATPTEHAESTEFFATVPIAAAAGGDPLPSGDWHLSTRLHADHIARNGTVAVMRTSKSLRWWKGARPMHAKLIASGNGAVLRVQPVDLVRAVKRRLTTR